MKIDVRDINIGTVSIDINGEQANKCIKDLLIIIYKLRDICNELEVDEDTIETTSGDIHLNDLRLRDNGENSAPYPIRST